MEIFLNDETREVAPETTLKNVLDTLGLPSFDGVAVSVNETVVRRDEWATRPLAPHDRLLLIRAAQGG
ncbi:MAG: sulfur carrier protein ThiS [Puniceicoccales bacterium]|jgi:sulfur carrier protein|nr:sulfur carrier protein ThiS [Puniceicoccales bacterium]